MKEQINRNEGNVEIFELADIWHDLQKKMRQEISGFDMVEAMQYAQALAHMSELKKAADTGDKGGRKGDICIVNFGYNCIHNEANYFMYALILKVTTNKVLVIPISESKEVYLQSYDDTNRKGKIHFMKFRQLFDKVPYATLILNDLHFINSHRIIRIEGHISSKDEEFQKIIKRLKKVLF